MKRRLLLITSSLLLCLCLVSCGSNPPSNETPQTQNSENEIIKLQAEVSAMKESLEASKAELKESNKKAKSLEALLDHLNKSVKSLEEKLKQTSDNSQSLEDQLTKAKEETERLKAQLNKEKEKAQNLESHLNRQGEFWADIYLCDNHYAYVCLERKEGVEKHEHEAELADSIVKSARVYFEAYTGK